VCVDGSSDLLVRTGLGTPFSSGSARGVVVLVVDDVWAATKSATMCVNVCFEDLIPPALIGFFSDGLAFSWLHDDPVDATTTYVTTRQVKPLYRIAENRIRRLYSNHSERTGMKKKLEQE